MTEAFEKYANATPNFGLKDDSGHLTEAIRRRNGPDQKDVSREQRRQVLDFEGASREQHR